MLALSSVKMLFRHNSCAAVSCARTRSANSHELKLIPCFSSQNRGALHVPAQSGSAGRYREACFFSLLAMLFENQNRRCEMSETKPIVYRCAESEVSRAVLSPEFRDVKTGPGTGRLSSARLHLFAKRTQSNPPKMFMNLHECSAMFRNVHPNARAPVTKRTQRRGSAEPDCLQKLADDLRDGLANFHQGRRERSSNLARKRHDDDRAGIPMTQ